MNGYSQKFCKIVSRDLPLEIFITSDLNPFLANVPISYPIKTPKNERFSGVFRDYK